jgi:hypothetical protein
VKPRFQADADLNEDIVTGVLRREPGVDFRTATEANLRNLTDAEVLQVAFGENRILVTHDRKTMPHAFGEFIQNGQSPGLLVVSQRADVLFVIEWLLLVWGLLRLKNGRTGWERFRRSSWPNLAAGRGDRSVADGRGADSGFLDDGIDRRQLTVSTRGCPSPPPLFFVSVASKGVSHAVSLLFATLAGRSISVAAKGLTGAICLQKGNWGEAEDFEGVRRTAWRERMVGRARRNRAD